MGLALGCMGMRREDWERLTIEEWDAVVSAYQNGCEREDHSAWERTRMLGCIMVQPYSKKKLTPRTVLPLPWDHEKSSSKVVSKEEDKKRLKELLERTAKS